MSNQTLNYVPNTQTLVIMSDGVCQKIFNLHIVLKHLNMDFFMMIKINMSNQN